jgi:hypothetical protein
MVAYDTSVIVQFLSGTGNEVITGGTDRMQTRLGIADDHVATVESFGARPFGMPPATRQAVSTALGYLTTQSRLYLRGHGDWEHSTLGGWTPKQVAGALQLCGLAISPAMISVTGCRCARAVAPGDEGKSFSSYGQRAAAEGALLQRSTFSFAGQLHAQLCGRGITSPLYGRIYTVTVVGDNDEDLEAGQKITATPSGEERHHRHHSKIRFDCINGQSTQSWAN